MAAKLSEVETKEVSLVDRGAVRLKFALTKADGALMEKLIKAALETPLDNEDAIDALLEKAAVDAKAAPAIKAALRLVASVADVMTDVQKASVLAKAFGAPAAAPSDEEEEEEEEEGAAPPFGKTPTTKSDSKQEPAVTDSKIAPEVQAHFDTLAKANKDLQEKLEKQEKALAVELEKAEAKECLEKAAADYPLVGATAKVGAFIHSLKKAGLWNEDAQEILKGAQEKAKAGELFSEKGTGRGNGGARSAEAELHKAATAIAEAKKIPFSKAYTEACEANKDLYAKYEQERTAR